MFDLPSTENVEKVVVEANVITEGARPLVIFSDDEDHKQASSST